MLEMFREEDENANVNGILLVFDCTGMGLKHLNQATMEQNKKMSRIYQVNNKACILDWTKLHWRYFIGLYIYCLKFTIKRLK